MNVVEKAAEAARHLFPPITSAERAATSSDLMNWSGITRLARRDQIVRPTTMEEIIGVVRDQRYRRVKAVGSGLTFEAVAAVDPEDAGVMIDMGNFVGLEEIGEGRARFGAGTPVDVVISELFKRGLMMPCSPGVIGIQTLAGAISTGSHGQGMKQSALSDMVTGVRIVHPDGDVVDIDEDDENLGAYICSLGVLGVIRSITIRTVPIRYFLCRKHNVTYKEFASSFLQWNQESEFCKAWWYPDTDLVHLWRIDESSPDSGGLPAAPAAVDKTLNGTIDVVSEKMSAHTKDAVRHGCQFATIERFRNTSDQAGYLHEIVCKGIPVPQINCEIAVPLDRFADALCALRSWLDTHGGIQRLHYPFIFRCTGQSKAWISPANAGPVCYIGFLVYLAGDGTWVEGGMEMMRELQVALAPCGGIPHFGYVSVQ